MLWTQSILFLINVFNLSSSLKQSVEMQKLFLLVYTYIVCRCMHIYIHTHIYYILCIEYFTICKVLSCVFSHLVPTIIPGKYNHSYFINENTDKSRSSEWQSHKSNRGLPVPDPAHFPPNVLLYKQQMRKYLLTYLCLYV